MSNAPQLYALYQQLLEQSQLMLRLARQGLWDDLIICETDYVNAVHSLARLTQESEPSMQIQEQLRPTLRVILDNEGQVKTLLQARMDELAKLVGQSSILEFRDLMEMVHAQPNTFTMFSLVLPHRR